MNTQWWSWPRHTLVISITIVFCHIKIFIAPAPNIIIDCSIRSQTINRMTKVRWDLFRILICVPAVISYTIFVNTTNMIIRNHCAMWALQALNALILGWYSITVFIRVYGSAIWICDTILLANRLVSVIKPIVSNTELLIRRGQALTICIWFASSADLSNWVAVGILYKTGAIWMRSALLLALIIIHGVTRIASQALSIVWSSFLKYTWWASWGACLAGATHKE